MISWQDGKTIGVTDIEDFEHHCGLRLPRPYTDLVLSRDGARPDPAAVLFEGPGGEVNLDRLIPFIDKDDPTGTMLRTCDRKPYGLPELLVPLGLEAGGCLFCFRYADGDEEEPSAAVLRNDTDGDERVVRIAEDFPALLGAIRTLADRKRAA
ncbi:SMI1/KNR4 family protein [Paracraurococcus lichenis]|uniref:SMI1/KNR4 family protein n=1 Tax=Paracraurococcus lichenis TaxID=3064888 RepID=A0ABT9EAD6_9PROT|nr:SMI1/KNR4 family protein [Paracraurococcus sp. LOR1-02]MDO9713169.1 SMI1/KNR4 family protein [Paracraurococcus sp. LOR1-02]